VLWLAAVGRARGAAAVGRTLSRRGGVAAAAGVAGVLGAGLAMQWAGVTGPRPPDWFGRDADVWGVPAFAIMGVWSAGAGMIIYLAGLKGIPMSLYESARIDGANAWRRFVSITVPMLSPLIFFNLVMGVIGSFQVFTQAYVMTRGGPDDATLFYNLKLYFEAFENHRMGYASAMAWLLFVLLLGLTLLLFRGARRWVYYEGFR
jgi:multiple sugar transport system permease protein